MNQQLEYRLKSLGLEYTALHIDHLVEDASRDNISYLDFLINLVNEEWEQREKQLLEKRIHTARFPFSKSISDFDFEFQPSVNEKRVKETLTCRFIENGENRILLGPPGVGKTHLAISFGMEALIKGYTVKFITADEFVNECRKASAKETLHYFINRMSKPDILIVDELGYFPFDELTANVFFQIVSKRYERGAMILTSNKSYVEWGKVFGDDVLATAILDRLLHHSVTFNIKGESFRMKEKKQAGIIPVQL